MQRIPTLLIVPYSPASPIFPSEAFFALLDKLCALNFEGIVFPFYIDGYVKRYAGVYILHGRIKTFFGENFASNILRLDMHSGGIDFVLFPYIFLPRKQSEDIFSICLDDDESMKEGENTLFIPKITTEKDIKSIENSTKFSKLCGKCKKHVKICIQTLEKLIE